MNGFAIVKLEADKADIVSEFNNYMQQNTHAPSFVSGTEGYFRLSYEAIPSSAGIVEFGKFLQSTGYSITAIGSVNAKEGDTGTEVCFEKGGVQTCAVLSTKNVY